ncbi:MAG: ADP-ribosylglycohydrolase family protein [Bacteroidota bacterium]
MSNMHPQRLTLARRSLQGVSIGDAFGESFFGERAIVLQHIQSKSLPPTQWEFTDDTVMALAVFEQLEAHCSIKQDDLVRSFVHKHELDPQRGYGATVRRILRTISQGEQWQTASSSAFDGMGSMGNGAAMRVSPIGAYFYDDLDAVKTMAAQSAHVTHAHPEATAGAMAVSLATALVTKAHINDKMLSAENLIEQVAQGLPDSDTRSKIRKSLQVPTSYRMETIRQILGNGERMTAQDTVPFAIWCAAHYRQDFSQALWKAVAALGDRDTICAIVGGISIMGCDEKTIPRQWEQSVESIDESIFRQL